MPSFLVMRKLCLTVCAVIAAASAPAAAREALAVNVERNAETGDMIIWVIFPGCISSSVPYLGNDIEVSVDESTASVRVDGKFELGLSPRIQTSDCNGRLQEKFTIEGTAPRRYRIFNNGDYADVKDFALTIEEQNIKCATTFGINGVRSYLHSRNRFCDWRSLKTDAAAPDLLSLILKLSGGHPVRDNNPETDIDISITPSADRGVGMFLELLGIEDDAVAGRRFRGKAIKEDAGWRFAALITQDLCVRGDNAGQWMKEGCD